jgi:hypothetical protein
MPELLVTFWEDTPVAASVASTVAPGTAFPELSLTYPVIAPVTAVCACSHVTLNARSIDASTTTRVLATFIMISPINEADSCTELVSHTLAFWPAKHGSHVQHAFPHQHARVKSVSETRPGTPLEHGF